MKPMARTQAVRPTMTFWRMFRYKGTLRSSRPVAEPDGGTAHDISLHLGAVIEFLQHLWPVVPTSGCPARAVA